MNAVPMCAVRPRLQCWPSLHAFLGCGSLWSLWVWNLAFEAESTAACQKHRLLSTLKTCKALKTQTEQNKTSCTNAHQYWCWMVHFRNIASTVVGCDQRPTNLLLLGLRLREKLLCFMPGQKANFHRTFFNMHHGALATVKKLCLASS